MIRQIPFNIILFIVMIAIFPVIELLNGFLLTSNASISVPVGAIYRILLCVFLIVMILVAGLRRSAITVIIIMFVIGNLTIFIVQGIFFQSPLSILFEDISVHIKYFIWVLIPLYIYQRKKFFQNIHYETIFIIISFFFTMGLITPYLLGLGYQTYANSDAGYKGFFFANNDTSFAFIISITYTAKVFVLSLAEDWGVRITFLLSLFIGNIFCLLLIGTKTGIVYGLFIGIMVLVKLLFYAKYKSIWKALFIWLGAILALSWLAFKGVSYMSQMVAGTYERIIYFYYLYDGNLIRLLTSSRSDFLEGGMTFFLGDPNFKFNLLFGQGFEHRLEAFGRLGLIEMDFFDTLFGLGLMGILFLCVTIGYFIAIAFEKDSRSIHSYVLIVILVYSFFAGHVLFSALSTTLLGLVCGGIILSKKECE
ncbi:hypothetical protein HCJ57_15845 [Listeria booriae]|uniref:O-antigen ligase family protein n=1 Tax=Listeria booriae TaxID=1552123 RepID=UPI001624436B|nr:O-antigen ligase family protein [Listeria booriae]MBC2057999.1 hypothetical protein [Listeria booriae]MBC2069381.1 hypothetical protein [Listeria booriae]